VPSDIRRDGGVARMSDVSLINEIIAAVTIPVMAKARIGHFVEAQVLQSLGVDYIDESEVLTPADEEHHIDKWQFDVPFVCGARDLGEALRRIGEGAAMIRTKGEAGTGNVVEAVRHMRAVQGGIRRIASMRPEELMAEAIGKVDVVITTALVPGRRAPILVTEKAVELMKPGSVIVDLAGEQGGNCELSEPGESVIRHDVKILAPLNVPSTMAEHASQLYARNVQALLGLMIKDGQLELDFEDEVIAGACITRDGEIVHEGAKQAAGAATS